MSVRVTVNNLNSGQSTVVLSPAPIGLDELATSGGLFNGYDTFSLERDMEGKITHIDCSKNGEVVVSADVVWDAEQVTSVTSDGVTVTFTYDPSGSLLGGEIGYSA